MAREVGVPRYLIDTREQLPISLPRSERMKLIVGDYTTTKHFNKLHLERKSPGDLYGTLLGGHVRFRKEIRRAAERRIKLIVVIECTSADFFNKTWYGAQYCKVSDITLRRIIATLKRKYGLRFVWCADRNELKATIVRLLK